jgi:hypothetical protein
LTDADTAPEPQGSKEDGGKEASPNFDVFLSHNSKDKPIVREIAAALRAEFLHPWLDEEELIPGRFWQQPLEKVIETCRTAAVLVGPSGLGPWQEPEMVACLSEFVNRKLPVLPVLLPGAPEAPKLPLFLKSLTWVDLREGLSGVNWDRLIWGITGKKPIRSKSRQTDPAPIIPAIPALATSPNLAPQATSIATIPAEEHEAPSDQKALSQESMEFKPPTSPNLAPQATSIAAVPPEGQVESKPTFGFSRVLPPTIGWTFAFSAVIITFQTIADWPAEPTVGYWFWFVVLWLVLGVVACCIGAFYHDIYCCDNNENPMSAGFFGLGVCVSVLTALYAVLDFERKRPEDALPLFFPGQFLCVTSAALAGGLIYSLMLFSSRGNFLVKWLS